MSDPQGSASPDPTELYTHTHAYSDPAYGGSTSYSPGYSSAGTFGLTPTEQLPPYWTQTSPQPPTTGTTPDGNPPDPPREPRPWLWALAGFAVAAVIALIAYMVFVVASPTKDKSVAAPSSTLTPTMRTPTRTPSLPPGMPPLPTALPSLPPVPIPLPGPPSSSSGATEPVTYEVSGDGIALTISYNDTGGVMQNEFGVQLPWHKVVDLPKPAKESASIIVTNSGKNVTCSISVGGKKIAERKGAVLTICAPTG
jgi:hypothetical protein